MKALHNSIGSKAAALLLLLVFTVSAVYSADLPARLWVFSTAGSDQGWSAQTCPDFGSSGVNAGYWWGTTAGPNPFVLGPDYLGITASSTHYISIKMRLHLLSSPTDRFGSSDAKIYWRTDSSAVFDENKVVSYKTYGNGEWKTYNVRMGNHARWTGSIEQLRIHPCSKPGARVEIAFIKVMQDITPPEYAAENMWTYSDGESTNDNTPTIHLRNCYDQVSGISRVEFFRRSGTLTGNSGWAYAGADMDGSDGYQFKYPQIPNGTYDLGVKVYDGAGNIANWQNGDEKWIDDLTINTNLQTRIDVDAGSILGAVPKEVCGNNLMWNQFSSKYNPATGRLTDGLEAKIAEMGVPVLRYPGGCYSDTFYWKKSIGPLASRPNQYVNGCNTTLSGNTPVKFGLDEFLCFCEQRGLQPMITCRFRWPGGPRAGSGGIILDSEDPYGEALADAEDLVEYCNSPNDGSNPNGGTDWAAMRMANGHPQPYNVKLFEIGNEPWGPDPWGSPGNYGFDGPSEYAVAFLKYLERMKAVDPTVKVSATTHLQSQLDFDPAKLEWANSVYEQVGTFIDYAQGHPYLPYSAWNTDIINLYDETMATPKAIDDLLSRQKILLKLAAPEKADTIKLRLTEWNINYNWWHDPAQGRINTYHTATLKAAIALADTFRVYMENRDLVESAEWWHLYQGYWGCIISETSVNPAYHTFRIFNRHFGDNLVGCKVTGSPKFDYVQVGGVLKTQWDQAHLTAIASKSVDGKSVYLVVINKDRLNARSSQINLTDFPSSIHNQVKAEVWELNGPDVDDYTNVGNVKITQSTDTYNPSFTYSFPAHSITSFKFTAAPLVIGSLGELRSKEDGTEVSVEEKAVTAIFSPGAFYIEDMNRASGIRVESATLPSSDTIKAAVEGTISTNTDGEKCILASEVTSGSPGSVEPLAITNPRPEEMVQGLLVKMWGRVTQVDPGSSYFYIDDGSGLRDGTQTSGIDNIGIRVEPAGTMPSSGQFVVITGIRSCKKVDGNSIKLLRGRKPGDVQVVAGISDQ